MESTQEIQLAETVLSYFYRQFQPINIINHLEFRLKTNACILKYFSPRLGFSFCVAVQLYIDCIRFVW